MKKLFISCPMKGRTEENIRKSMKKMHKMAEIIFDQELEVIPTYIEHIPPETKDKSIWCLGESIKKMAEADFFIGIGWDEYFKGCEIERIVAKEYGIKSTNINVYELMPDVKEIRDKILCVGDACGRGPING